MASPGCAGGSFQAGQGQYVGEEGGVNCAQLGVDIDAARIAAPKSPRRAQALLRFMVPPLVGSRCRSKLAPRRAPIDSSCSSRLCDSAMNRLGCEPEQVRSKCDEQV